MQEPLSSRRSQISLLTLLFSLSEITGFFVIHALYMTGMSTIYTAANLMVRDSLLCSVIFLIITS